MERSTFTILSRTYLLTLGILSFWFMTEMAMADPLCANCSVNLVVWALPRAEILMVGWVIAGLGTLWTFRGSVFHAFRHLKPSKKVVANIQD